MRIVDVPSPDSVLTLTVTKPVAEHMDLADLLAGRRQTAADAFAAKLVGALRTAMAGGDRAWEVAWLRHHAGAWVGMEAQEQVTLGCDGADGGVALYERLVAALGAENLVEVEPRGRQSAHASSPIACRWHGWSFGRKIGDFRARLEVDATAEGVTPRPIPELRCPRCQGFGRPAQTISGLPIPGLLELAEALGEPLDVRGCIVDPDEDLPDWSCARCGVGLVPGSLDPEEIADLILNPGWKPVPRCARTYTDGRTVLWTPDFALRGGGWSYRLFPGVAARLDAAERAWVVPRHGSGAAVFFDWERFRTLLPEPLDVPARLRVAAGEQLKMKLGRKGVQGELSPWSAARSERASVP